MQEIGRILIILGLSFDFIGVLALLRMPDVYSRLHGSFKCINFGTAFIMLGVFFSSGLSNSGFKSLLVIMFLFITAPVSAHVLARAAFKTKARIEDGAVCNIYVDDKKEKENLS